MRQHCIEACFDKIERAGVTHPEFDGVRKPFLSGQPRRSLNEVKTEVNAEYVTVKVWPPHQLPRGEATIATVRDPSGRAPGGV